MRFLGPAASPLGPPDLFQQVRWAVPCKRWAVVPHCRVPGNSNDMARLRGTASWGRRWLWGLGCWVFPSCGRKWCNMAWYHWNIGYSRHNFSHRMAMFECCWFMFLRRWAWQTVFWEFSHVSRYVGNSTVSRWCFPNFHMAPWSQSCENSWFLCSDGSIWLGFTRQICSILVKRNSWFAWPGPGWLLYKHLLQGPRCHIAMDGCWKPAGHGRHLTYVAVRSLNTMVVVFATQGKPIYII